VRSIQEPANYGREIRQQTERVLEHQRNLEAAGGISTTSSRPPCPEDMNDSGHDEVYPLLHVRSTGSLNGPGSRFLKTRSWKSK